jgi:hypothetical protein
MRLGHTEGRAQCTGEVDDVGPHVLCRTAVEQVVALIVVKGRRRSSGIEPGLSARAVRPVRSSARGRGVLDDVELARGALPELPSYQRASLACLATIQSRDRAHRCSRSTAQRSSRGGLAARAARG